MSKDWFDIEVGNLLRDAEAQAPADAWARIQESLELPDAGSSAASGSMGFGAAAVIGGALLLSTAVYSDLRGPATAGSEAVLVAEKEISMPQAEVEQAGAGIAQYEAEAGESKASEATVQVQPIEADEAVQEELIPSIQSTHIPDETVKAADSEQELSEAAIPLEEDDSESKAAEGHSSPPVDNSAAEGQGKETKATADESAESPEQTIDASEEQAQVHTPSQTQKADAKLSASIQAANRTGYAPFEIEFKAAGNFRDVQWDFGSLGSSSEAQVRKVFDKPGNYTVMLMAYGADGEVVSDMITVEVREGSNLLVPDSFTPNGDGINDTFKAEGVNLKEFQMSIMDARGKLVFQSNNIDEAWHFDGPLGGELESYLVLIQARGLDGKDYNIRKRIQVLF